MEIRLTSRSYFAGRTAHIFLSLFIAILTFPLFAVSTRKIVDDSALRRELKESWLIAEPAKVLSNIPKTYTLEGGGRVEVRTAEGKEEFSVIFAREISNSGIFPYWSQGSWQLTRKKNGGEALRIQIFLRSDQNTYIQLRKLNNEKCLLDMVIYDAYFLKSLPITLPPMLQEERIKKIYASPFEWLYTAPVEDILALAGEKFKRRYFEPDPILYRDSRQFIGEVRKRLHGLSYGDDGAIDENGRYVFINTLKGQAGKGELNCSGFAKWIVDGILWNYTGGKRLAIPPLKAPFGERGSSFSDPFERLRDPYFGLDWTRNLASIAGKTIRGTVYGELEEIEVQKWHFSGIIMRDSQGRISDFSFPGYLPDTGFGIEGLMPLLYSLAIDEPGYVYLASVNEERGAPVTPANLRGSPRLREHFHIGILAPYFDDADRFQVAVFESAEETSINSFKNHPGRYVNLVRIPVQAAFY
jgi:hypothetical protein